MVKSISPVYEIYLYEAVSVQESFILGEAQLNIAGLGTTTISSKPIALLEGWSLLAFTSRINKPDNHQVRFDLSPDDPLVDTLRDLVDVDTLMYIWRTNPLTGTRQMVYAGMNRTVVDQARITGSLIITLYGSGPTHLLKRRIVLPPSGDITSSKTGTAEDVMKEYVLEQAASPTDSDRVFPGLLIEQDLGLTGDGDYSANRTNLFTVLERVGEQGIVDFKVVPYQKGRKTTVGTEEAAALPMAMSGLYDDGIVIGSADTKFGKDKFVATLDGDDYIDLHSSEFNSLFNGSEGSVSLWFKVDGPTTWTDGNTRYIFFFEVDANNYIRILKRSANNSMRFRYSAGGTVESIDYTISDNDWVNVVMTWSKTDDEFSVYVNGAEIAGSPRGTLGNWAGSLDSTLTLLGAEDQTGTNGWNGLLAQVAVWSDVLTTDEILALYNNPLAQRKQILTTQSSAQIAYWPLNDSDETFFPGVFEFRARKPWGRVAYVGNAEGELPYIFDMFLGNMEIPIFSTNSAKEINYVYLLGAGQEPNQVASEISSGGRIALSPWNRLELSKSFPRATTVAELEAEGNRLLEERKAIEKFTFNVRQTDGYSWPDDWELGDLTTARYFDNNFVKQIIEVDVLVTAGGMGSSAQTEVVTAEIRNYTTGWLLGIEGLGELGEKTFV